MNGADTLYNSVNYTKVINCVNDAYIGAFRQANRQSYIIPRDSTAEFLIYDFSVELGDTIKDVHFFLQGNTFMASDLIVAHIDSSNTTGIYRTYIYFTDGQS